MFGPEDQQEAVYEDVSDLVISAADGFNVCIMAYGQTGSGKTFTMQGTQQRPGINMRALRELFQLAESRADSMRMTVQASILEIYNDSIFDLLSASPRESGSKLDIKELKCVPPPALSCNVLQLRVAAARQQRRGIADRTERVPLAAALPVRTNAQECLCQDGGWTIEAWSCRHRASRVATHGLTCAVVRKALGRS